jgi:hypothetical protein
MAIRRDLAYEFAEILGFSEILVEAGRLLLEAFMEAGVPAWKVREKTSDPLKWNMIAEGTADSFEAVKAAALYEAETALRKP